MQGFRERNRTVARSWPDLDRLWGTCSRCARRGGRAARSLPRRTGRALTACHSRGRVRERVQPLDWRLYVAQLLRLLPEPPVVVAGPLPVRLALGYLSPLQDCGDEIPLERGTLRQPAHGLHQGVGLGAT